MYHVLVLISLQPFITEVQTCRRNKTAHKEQRKVCRHISTKILKYHLTSSVLVMKPDVGFPPQAAEAAPEEPNGSAGSWYSPQWSEESITP